MLQTVDEKLALIDEFPYNELPRSTKLVEYEERMKKVLTGLGFGRICFAHNDCVSLALKITNPSCIRGLYQPMAFGLRSPFSLEPEKPYLECTRQDPFVY